LGSVVRGVEKVCSVEWLGRGEVEWVEGLGWVVGKGGGGGGGGKGGKEKEGRRGRGRKEEGKGGRLRLAGCPSLTCQGPSQPL